MPHFNCAGITSYAGLNDAGVCMFMCIVHNTPEDGRVADDTGGAGSSCRGGLKD